MALNIKNEKVEQLAKELAQITGESRIAAIQHALEERRERIARESPSGSQRIAQALDFLENEIWPNIPRRLLGRPMTKREREKILGYGGSGV
jgi:antitoxin VapB